MARRADADRIAQRARASGHGQIAQVGGDLYITAV